MAAKKDETVKRPSFQFYPKEWIWDLELRQCSPAARGLWVDLMCLMHEGVPYGHLTTPLDLILRVTGLSEPEFKTLLAELETARASGKPVASRNPKGVIYSRRMMRDEADRATRAANGGNGGRPRKAVAPMSTLAPMEEGFDVEASFDRLWEAYPAKGRTQKPLSQQYFVDHVHTRETFETVIGAVTGKWAHSKKWADGFVMALARFLDQECWKEDPEPAAKHSSESGYQAGYKPPSRDDE